MKVEKISYSQSRESANTIGLKRWDKIGMEAQLQDGDIYEDCFSELKKEVENALKKANPGSIIEVNQDYSHLLQPTINKEKERTEIEMENCATIEQLKSFENLAMKYDLVQEYINKKQSLLK